MNIVLSTAETAIKLGKSHGNGDLVKLQVSEDELTFYVALV